MQQKKIDQSLSFHLKYAFRFSKESNLGRLFPHTYQGIGVSYQTFFSPVELGNPVSVYAFQGSRIAQLSPRLSLDYEWNFGASFGWRKYDELSNPQNVLIGSKINAYINLGFLLNWQVHKYWKLAAGVDLTHFPMETRIILMAVLMLLEEESASYALWTRMRHPVPSLLDGSL